MLLTVKQWHNDSNEINIKHSYKIQNKILAYETAARSLKKKEQKQKQKPKHKHKPKF